MEPHSVYVMRKALMKGGLPEDEADRLAWRCYTALEHDRREEEHRLRQSAKEDK